MAEKKRTRMQAIDDTMLENVSGGVSGSDISLGNIASNVVDNITNQAESMVKNVDPGKVLDEIKDNFNKETDRIATGIILNSGDPRNA